jgi:hypothetical protein
MFDPNINKREPPFPVGAKVWLRRSPHGAPGRIVKVVRGKLVVLWPGHWRPSLDSPANLVLAVEEEDDPR